MTVHSPVCVLDVNSKYDLNFLTSFLRLTNQQTLCLYSDLPSVWRAYIAPRHSLHGKPTSLDKVATSRFIAIMSQRLLLYPIFFKIATRNCKFNHFFIKIAKNSWLILIFFNIFNFCDLFFVNNNYHWTLHITIYYAIFCCKTFL